MSSRPTIIDAEFVVISPGRLPLPAPTPTKVPSVARLVWMMLLGTLGLSLLG